MKPAAEKSRKKAKSTKSEQGSSNAQEAQTIPWEEVSITLHRLHHLIAHLSQHDNLHGFVTRSSNVMPPSLKVINGC